MDHHHHHSDPESSSRNITWSGDDDSVRNLLQPRSNFSCTFCKRGFSNAQALGGHMNVHRRDRAKLKEFSCENNMLSLDINKSFDNCEEMIMRGPPDHHDDDESSTVDKLISSTDDNQKAADGDSILRGLPLFVEAKVVEEAKSVDRRFGDDELDLELRLGPHQPNYYSKPKT